MEIETLPREVSLQQSKMRKIVHRKRTDDELRTTLFKASRPRGLAGPPALRVTHKICNAGLTASHSTKDHHYPTPLRKTPEEPACERDAAQDLAVGQPVPLISTQQARGTTWRTMDNSLPSPSPSPSLRKINFLRMTAGSAKQNIFVFSLPSCSIQSFELGHESLTHCSSYQGQFVKLAVFGI